MRKSCELLRVFLSINLMFCFLMMPECVHAKTLGELKAELNAEEEKYKNAEKEETETQNKIELNNKTIDEIEKNVSQMEKDLVTLSEEIQKLNEQIEEKDRELKKIVNFFQKTQGESAYLEYAFGAQDFTDFIYRVSVSEQLAKYNEKLIEESEKLIKQNKKYQEEMETKKAELAKEKERLNTEVSKLGDKLEEISFIKIDAAKEIDMQREAIRVLESTGCKDNENIDTCGNKLPPDTAFLRPIISGYVTSEYGYRISPINGNPELHEALDMSNSNRTVPIYAAANGIVIGMISRSSCGGNMLFILHTINGEKYTTEYAHLRTIDVSIGQVVTKNTQIATMGGDPNTEWWDGCSTQQHLHFGIAHGHYLKDYYSWSTFLSNTFDPRTIVNFPYTGGNVDPFADRFTKY